MNICSIAYSWLNLGMEFNNDMMNLSKKKDALSRTSLCNHI